jgi:hypothetical protein
MQELMVSARDLYELETSLSSTLMQEDAFIRATNSLLKQKGYKQINGLDSVIPCEFVDILALDACYSKFCERNGITPNNPIIYKKVGKQIMAECPTTKKDNFCFYPAWVGFLENRPSFNENGDLYFFVFIDCSNGGKVYLSREFLYYMDVRLVSISQPSKTVTVNTYVMLDANTGYYKIGRSKSILEREKALQSEKPTIELVFSIEKNVESELHKKFASKRVRGEWFALTSDDLKSILEYKK